MKPKIWNDITNILAKLAGSSDYDPKVKYDTALEYYGNQIPVLPKPGAGDSGKGVFVKTDGTFELKNANDADSVHYTADTGKTDAQKAQARENIGAVSKSELGVLFTFKGSVATLADLPASDNNVGDVWFVEAESANFVWLVDETYPNGFWDEFGQPIDLSLYVLKPTVNTVSGATPSITPVANNVYECGELTSLTITNPPATGMYVIKFTSGSTATVTTIPASIVFPEAFSADADMRYEINVEDGYAVAVGWPVS